MEVSTVRDSRYSSPPGVWEQGPKSSEGTRCVAAAHRCELRRVGILLAAA